MTFNPPSRHPRASADPDSIAIVSTKIQLESQGADPLPEAIADRASVLMQEIIGGAGEGDLHNNEFLSSLARVRFVPARVPPPAHRRDGNSVADTDGGEGGGSRGDGWGGGVVLVRFEDAAVLKDRNLVFTAFPVHMTGLAPLQVRMARVGAAKYSCSATMSGGCPCLTASGL